eukprot:g5558.t1
MPDAAGQSGGDLESHLESLLGEIEATQHEVEARSPKPDEPTSDPIAEPADHNDETRSPEDQTLDVLSEVEADLGELMDAISDLGDASIEHEPLVETRVDEPEGDDPPGTAPEPADTHHTDTTDELSSMTPDAALGDVSPPEPDEPLTETPGAQDEAPEADREPEPEHETDDSAGAIVDDIANDVTGDLMGLLGDEPEPARASAATQEAVAVPEPSEPDEAPLDERPEDTPPAPAAPGASDHESGDSLDDMLAAASEELLADEASDPAPLVESEPAQPVHSDEPEPEQEQEPEQDADAELLDAVAALGNSTAFKAPEPVDEDHHDTAEAVAGVVEIPTAPEPEAPEPDEQPSGVSTEDEPAPAPEPEPVSATVEEIPPRPEPAPPTGRLAPMIIAWRATRRTLAPQAAA